MMVTRVRVTRFLCRIKTEYMKSNFNINQIMRDNIKLEEKETASIGCFKYLVMGTSNKL